VVAPKAWGGANSLFSIGFISKNTPWGLKLFITFLWGAKTTFSDFSVPPQGVYFLENHLFHMFYKQHMLNSLIFISFISKTTSELLPGAPDLSPDCYFDM